MAFELAHVSFASSSASPFGVAFRPPGADTAVETWAYAAPFLPGAAASRS